MRGNLKRVYVMPQDTTRHCGPQITVSSCGFHAHHTTNGPLACALISDFNMSPFRAAVLWAEPSIAVVFYFVFIATRWRIRPRNRFPASFQSSSNQTERSFPIFNSLIFFCTPPSEFWFTLHSLCNRVSLHKIILGLDP